MYYPGIRMLFGRLLGGIGRKMGWFVDFLPFFFFFPLISHSLLFSSQNGPFQLISWSTDQTLRLWNVPPKVVNSFGKNFVLLFLVCFSFFFLFFSLIFANFLFFLPFSKRDNF